MCLNSWLLTYVIVTLVIIHPTKSAHFCSNTTMPANNSAYQTNLNTLYRLLNTNATDNPSGYYKTKVDNPTSETIYGSYLCRGDQDIGACHWCVVLATTTALPESCPNRKTAILWHTGCMVRYSNESFFNDTKQSPYATELDTDVILGNVTEFLNELKNMMRLIIIRAADGGPIKKFAVDSVNYSISYTVYGLGQCRPDMNRNDCYRCLNTSSQTINHLGGVQFMGPNCNIRYETYPFFNLSYLSTSPGRPSPDSLPSPVIFVPIHSGGNRKSSAYKILISITGGVSFLLITTVIFTFTMRIKRSERKLEKGNGDMKIVDSLQLDFSSLLLATDNFSDSKRLGNGTATVMYKGVHPNGQEIVVKKLCKGDRGSEQEFDNEVLLSANLQHKNLVKLLGFCIEKDLRYLVYEFLPNGNLEGFLKDPIERAKLNWQKRFDIMRGVARGLLYLHEDSQVRVIHRDLKPSNILLGAQMDSKISNFRTARLVHGDHTKEDTKVVGTYGYMPQEYVQHGYSSIKSDVFSYGVILLEVITGSIITGFSNADEEECLLTYVWRKWSEGAALDVVDQLLPETHKQRCTYQIERCIKIALLCVQEDLRRPRMSSVVQMLNSDTVDISEPVRPAPLIFHNVDEPSTVSDP